MPKLGSKEQCKQLAHRINLEGQHWLPNEQELLGTANKTSSDDVMSKLAKKFKRTYGW